MKQEIVNFNKVFFEYPPGRKKSLQNLFDRFDYLVENKYDQITCEKLKLMLAWNP